VRLLTSGPAVERANNVSEQSKLAHREDYLKVLSLIAAVKQYEIVIK
jgi:hypothetical protein